MQNYLYLNKFNSDQPPYIIATGGSHMAKLTVDSFKQALEVRKKFPQVFYTLNYQQVIVDAAKADPSFFEIREKQDA